MADEKENKARSFVLRIDSETMQAIEKWADDEFRSANGQILYLLNQALKRSGRTPKKKRQHGGDDEKSSQ
ncbi:MAG: Arc family DNA-binding protein [Tannerella sp.]|jgi:hypothetical protein|nr:Arc family DNA-binding protein [Tannerella sp.]